MDRRTRQSFVLDKSGRSARQRRRSGSLTSGRQRRPEPNRTPLGASSLSLPLCARPDAGWETTGRPSSIASARAAILRPMQLRDGHLWLSPSDLTAYLACPHLTTLRSRSARGEREPAARPGGARRPRRREGRPARGALPRAPARARAARSSRSSCRASPARSSAAARRDRRRDARRRRGHLPGDLLARRLARAGRLPHPRRRAVRASAPGATSRTTRSSRARRSRRPCSSSRGTRTRSRRSRGGCPSGCTSCSGRARSRSTGPADVDAYLRDGAAAAARARRGAARDVPVAVRALLALRLHLGLPRSAGRTTTT